MLQQRACAGPGIMRCVSFVFAVGRDVVWSPALRVGQVYVAEVRALEDIVEESAGFSENASDMIVLNPKKLKSFVVAAVAMNQGQHQVLDMLLSPVLLPSIVMLERSGLSLNGLVPSDIWDAAQELAAAMPV